MVKAVRTPGKVKLTFTLLIGATLVWLTFSLGQWQTGRAQEKQTLFDAQARALAAEPVSPASAQLDLDNLSYRKIELKGRFEAKALIYIDNRQVNGRPAVQVVQGFRPEGESFLIPWIVAWCFATRLNHALRPRCLRRLSRLSSCLNCKAPFCRVLPSLLSYGVLPWAAQRTL